jgi:trans-aconitate methyltransferase
VQESLAGNATDVEASATESTTLLDTRYLETELSGLDGSDVATGTAADNDDVLLRCSTKKHNNTT